MKLTKLTAYELRELISLFDSLERHPENKNTVTTGEHLLEKIIKNTPSFDIHVTDNNKVIQNYDTLLWVYEVLLTKNPYCYSPIFNSICDSDQSVPLSVIYDDSKLFNYLRYYPEYLSELRKVQKNIHKHGIPIHFIGDESIEFYLKNR
ncbi:MAG: hypothetical protein AN483_12845 [Aphanizomenon flos-aquae MDT14a]|jgi:hypothetical protein|uniref:Uncharacterized protein n=1 Tax=Aphanizomenon flos-aquae WA102 TaxID=1710896 RepID=A0A1B7X2N6_APHFL|nr:MAG: hypothetical protein AN483_12845 [Aphanizomenon flos-aquae MDT14a]OBQ43618.1 MAG: hypothetical protein AN484_11485 [Aphanizomenon flos-aquae WA102]